MTIQDLGALGELVAAVVVVITLAYLTIQDLRWRHPSH